MYYGGDYNPEQFPPHVWEEDVARMQEAGVTLVSLGIFSWSRIQPAEGEFDFEWLDRVIGLLHDGGIAVDLATATASPPPWAVQQYPDILPQDENGARYWPGSRQHYAPTSPSYRRLAAELVHAIAERYVDHPAVVMWHVNNEYACHLRHDYSDNAAAAFRQWLRAKYGDVGTLNEAWGNAFWSSLVTDFEQVHPPRKAPYSVNPAGLLDFKRFSSDALLELYTMERDILLSHGATQPITTNFMGAFVAADYWKWAPEIDVITDDSYPDPNDPEAFRAAAFTRDLMRSLGGQKPWILMEQAAGAVNWRATNAPKAPGQMAALSMQAVGRGADGVMFFQWRQSRRGAEKFHSAMLPHAGTGTRTWREVAQLGADLKALGDLGSADGRARVALVFDWENWWAVEGSDHPVVLDYVALVSRWYAALHRRHVMVDIVHPEGDLGGYALVIAAQQYLVTDAAAANLRGFVERGGHLLMTAFSDVVDESDAFRDGGFTVALRDLLGAQVQEFGALVPPEFDASAPGERFAPLDGPFGSGTGILLAEELDVVDAEVLAHFTEGRRSGDPALTRKRTGAGRAYYLATVPDEVTTGGLTAWLLAEAGVEPLVAGASEFVEVARRGDVLTVINHSAERTEVALAGTDVLTGDVVETLELDAYEWRMVRPR